MRSMLDPRLTDLERRTVWLFGAPRTGSSWFLQLLCSNGRVVGLNEPLIGVHLEPMITELVGLSPADIDPGSLAMPQWRSEPAYFFAEPQRAAWAPDLRRMILRRFRAQVRAERRTRRPLVLVKEPNGTQAASLLLSLHPRSRMIFLLRDGRDAIDSELAAASEGGWVAREIHAAVEDRERFLRERAHVWLWRTRAAIAAFEALAPERRLLVRYEELRAEPLRVLESVGSWLGLDGAEWSAAVSKLAFEKVEGRGPGEFVRSAAPGAWRRNLSASEQNVLDSLLGETLNELGYEAPRPG